jgi:hypothetical protein
MQKLQAGGFSRIFAIIFIATQAVNMPATGKIPLPRSTKAAKTKL